MNYFSTLLSFPPPSYLSSLSFQLLDFTSQGFITIKEVKRMIDGLTQLWNSLTGGKVVSRQEYIEFVFGKMDQEKEGKVTKEKYTIYILINE